MERYKQYTDIRKDVRGKSLYSTLRYPNPPPKSSDIYIYSKRFMRMDLLAHAYYGDVTLWPIIAVANNIGKGTLIIEPGKRLRIPYPLSETEREDLFFEINERS